MNTTAPSRLEMERRLREAGVAVRPYPMLDKVLAASDPEQADRMLIAAGTAWEKEIERLFAIQQQADALSNHGGFAQVFGEVCAKDGLPVALALLNEGVAYRYTAIYRLAADTMINVALADKHREPLPDFLAEVPLGSTFCQYVLRDGSFLTANSAEDARLGGHPYRGVMRSYCGVPVFDPEGRPIGTACHFDVASHEIVEEKLTQLKAAAHILSTYLVPPTHRA